MAFGIVGILAAAVCKDVDSKMTNKVWQGSRTEVSSTNLDIRLKCTLRTPKWRLATPITKHISGDLLRALVCGISIWKVIQSVNLGGV